MITGAAAAWLTFLPKFPLRCVSPASTRRTRQPGFLVERRSVPADLIIEKAGVRCTTPALTALAPCRTIGGDGIDAVLRSRRATLGQLWDALRLTTNRTGDADRRRLLLDSRSRPWSAAERRAHRLFRAAGIDGWAGSPIFGWSRTDRSTTSTSPSPGSGVAVEIDGRIHADPRNFEAERLRQNDLVLDGWLVLRFTWAMITESPTLWWWP